jgi:hypothetical protein
LGCADDRPGIEQVERTGPVGSGRRPGDAEPVACPPDPHRDLAPVGDEQVPDRAAFGWPASVSPLLRHRKRV